MFAGWNSNPTSRKKASASALYDRSANNASEHEAVQPANAAARPISSSYEASMAHLIRRNQRSDGGPAHTAAMARLGITTFESRQLPC